jgi:hypothetical protein
MAGMKTEKKYQDKYQPKQKLVSRASEEKIENREKRCVTAKYTYTLRSEESSIQTLTNYNVASIDIISRSNLPSSIDPTLPTIWNYNTAEKSDRKH